MYKTQKEEYNTWLRRYSDKYRKSMISALEKLFTHTEAETPKDAMTCIEKAKLERQYTIKGIRSFLNFCEEYDLLEEDFIESFRRKLKTPGRYGIDSYVPNDKEVRKSLEILKEEDSKGYILYKVMIESGMRGTELSHLIKNFDKDKVEEWDEEIAVYPNFHNRGNKNSYYVFLSLATFRELCGIIGEITSHHILRFQEKIRRDERLVCLKYLRKYQFTKLIESGVSFEIANFIQGRISRNVGFNHYLAKKTIAIREYKKMKLLLFSNLYIEG